MKTIGKPKIIGSLILKNPGTDANFIMDFICCDFDEIQLAYGNVGASRILIAVAKNIDLKMRGTDVKGLLIDNMLGILMPGTNAEGAVTVVEKLHLFLTVVAVELEDGWTMVGNRGGFMAQHEHTIVVTDGQPIILTETNGVWN